MVSKLHSGFGKFDQNPCCLIGVDVMFLAQVQVVGSFRFVGGFGLIFGRLMKFGFWLKCWRFRRFGTCFYGFCVGT